MKTIKINNKKVKNKHFAYDGCHKIYLLDDDSQKLEAKKLNYTIFPIKKLEGIYNNSCSLKFISTWNFETIVRQCENAVFE